MNGDDDDDDDDEAKQTNQIEVMQDCRSSCVTNRWHHDAFVVFIDLEFLFESTSLRHRGVDVRILVIVDMTIPWSLKNRVDLAT